MIRIEFPKVNLSEFPDDKAKIYALKRQVDMLTDNLMIVLDSIEDDEVGTAVETVTRTSQLINDSGYITEDDVPSGSVVDTALSSTSQNAVQNRVIKGALDGKVDKVTGKDLSTNDYTDTEKNKLAGIESGAEANVQSDWNATSGDAYIKNKPTIPTVPTNVSAFTNDAGYITGYTETDPTVPTWAKASTKPSYTASEVGALPDTTIIPTKTSDLTNDSNYITLNQVPTELPTVSASDNGKVLRVVSGAWSAVALPSASGVSF